MRALRPGTRAERWSVLREFCQEIEWREDLKIPIRARSEVVGMRVGKGLTSLLLGFVDNLSSIGYLDQPRQTERAKPENLAATIYQSLGLPREASWRDSDGRPHFIYHGDPIPGLS